MFFLLRTLSHLCLVNKYLMVFGACALTIRFFLFSFYVCCSPLQNLMLFFPHHHTVRRRRDVDVRVRGWRGGCVPPGPGPGAQARAATNRGLHRDHGAAHRGTVPIVLAAAICESNNPARLHHLPTSWRGYARWRPRRGPHPKPRSQRPALNRELTHGRSVILWLPRSGVPC